jgi:hypothetical protein
MIKRLERLKNTVNKYMADIRPDRLTTCQVRTEVGRKSTTKCIEFSWQYHVAGSHQFVRIFLIPCMDIKEHVGRAKSVFTVDGSNCSRP